MIQFWIRILDKLGLIFFRKISNSNSQYFFIYLGLFSILPLFLLSFFNYPASDDFDLSYESQVEPFWSLIVRRYFFWSGRYLSNILFCLNPLVINNYFLFKIIPIVLTTCFLFSIYFFISSFKFNISRLEKYSFTGLFFFLYVYQMPSVSEGFYWVTSLYVYLVSQILVLLFFSMLFHYFKSKKMIYFFLSCFFLLVAMGTNEITVVSLLFILFILFFYNLLALKNFNRILFFLLIIAVCLACIEVLSPGNMVRSSGIKANHQIVYSVLKTFQISLSLIMKWIPIITICCFFFIKKIAQLIEEQIDKKYIIHPFLSLIIFFSIVYIGVFPCFWSTNGPPPGRAANTIYFFFMIAYINFIFGVIYHYVILQKHDFNYSNNTKIVIGIIIIFFSLSNNNVTLAYHDLLSGKAYKYNNEMDSRIKLIENCQEQECVLPELINMPQTIYSKEVMGLTNDKKNWKNIEIARYFRKKSILVHPLDSLLTE